MVVRYLFLCVVCFFVFACIQSRSKIIEPTKIESLPVANNLEIGEVKISQVSASAVQVVVASLKGVSKGYVQYNNNKGLSGRFYESPAFIVGLVPGDYNFEFSLCNKGGTCSGVKSQAYTHVKREVTELDGLLADRKILNDEMALLEKSIRGTAESYIRGISAQALGPKERMLFVLVKYYLSLSSGSVADLLKESTVISFLDKIVLGQEQQGSGSGGGGGGGSGGGGFDSEMVTDPLGLFMALGAGTAALAGGGDANKVRLASAISVLYQRQDDLERRKKGLKHVLGDQKDGDLEVKAPDLKGVNYELKEVESDLKTLKNASDSLSPFRKADWDKLNPTINRHINFAKSKVGNSDYEKALNPERTSKRNWVALTIGGLLLYVADTNKVSDSFSLAGSVFSQAGKLFLEKLLPLQKRFWRLIADLGKINFKIKRWSQ